MQLCPRPACRYRSKHNTPALAWDTKLAAAAQTWADDCPWGLSDLPYGENMAFGYSSFGDVLDAWYSEVSSSVCGSSSGIQTLRSAGQAGAATLAWHNVVRVPCLDWQGAAGSQRGRLLDDAAVPACMLVSVCSCLTMTGVTLPTSLALVTRASSCGAKAASWAAQ